MNEPAGQVHITTAQEAAQIVEKFFRAVNLDPNANRLKLDQGIGWNLSRGSALIYIYIEKVQNIETIRVVSPMLYLPTENLLAFYRRCLELNFSTLGCAFAISKDVLYAVSERVIQGLDQAEFDNMMAQVGHVADTFDDKLAQEFGGRLLGQGR